MDVRLIDSMGSVDRIADAARVSFSKPASNYTGEQNLKLLRYLSDHDHWTPAAHVQITLWQKMPIFIARQFTKHTVGFVTNEVSRRYVDDPPEFFEPTEWRGRAQNKKQGSSDEVIDNLDNGAIIPKAYKVLMDYTLDIYSKMIEAGVAPEQARMVLPQSMYTEMYTTGSLAAWARAYKLRSESHAQKEIQDLAALWDREISSIPEIKPAWDILVNES
jgi:thymidylate synthase (FAD)